MRASFALLLLTATSTSLHAQTMPPNILGDWPQHSTTRPHPAVVTPGAPVSIAPPSDAVVLFNGTSLSQWTQGEGAPAKWKVSGGAFEVVPNTGALSTRASFGDVQLHIEWISPKPPHGTDQDRGNSGVFFEGGRYEVQVLDSYENVTYADGQAAAVYGQYPPLVNVSRPPGEWQSYDIVFHRPHFDAKGGLLAPARLTVFHNGVLVQDNVQLVGPTANQQRPPYEAHADRLPISLQDHGHPVRFRNVWVRDLEKK